MADTQTRSLPKVPEVLLKKRKQRTEAKTKALKGAEKERKKRKFKRGITFNRPEKLIRNFRAREHDGKRLKRLAKRVGNHLVEPEGELGFVVRMRGSKGLHPRTGKALKFLRLRQVNNGVFVRLDETVLKMLRMADPFVTWGIPNLASIRELIYKRAYGKVDKRRVPLTDNAVIEQQLGDKDILCMDDLVHEIFSVGPDFQSAIDFLWPFKLSSPTGGWRKKYTHFKDDGAYGYRGDKINDLMKRMV